MKQRKSNIHLTLRHLVMATALVICLICQAISGFAASPPVIRVVMDNNYPPYAFMDNQGTLKGIVIDQWRLWEKKTGIKAELTGMEWGEAQRRMQAGEFDVIDTIFKTAKREAFLDFSKPYAEIDFSIFLHNDISGIRDASDLKGFLVGVKSGGAVIDALKQHGIESMITFTDDRSIVEAARDAKIRVFVMGHYSALYFLNKLNIADRFRQTAPLFRGEFHRAVRKGNTELLKIVGDGFNAITRAEYQAIDKTWKGAAIGEAFPFKYIAYAVGLACTVGLFLLVWLIVLKRTVRSRTAELAQSEQRFRMLVENSINVIFLLDTDGVFQFVSPAWEKHFGYPASDVIGMPFAPFVHPDDVQPCLEYMVTVLNSGKAATSPVYRVRHADGSWRSFIANGSVYHEPSGAARYLGIGHDITEQLRADEERLAFEKQMLNTQKLESLGVLAGGIAHDFNNLLMAIMGNADLALMRISKESPAVDNLRMIEKASARAADLAKQMLAYSGKGHFVIETIDLNRLIEEMFHMLEVSISKKAVLRLNPHHQLPSVEADTTQMRQVIMNLVINASEAIGDKSGIIAVTTGVMDCDRNYLKDVWLDENIGEGLYVYLEIADTGCGMDKETVSKLFDPFFTTKFTGRGLGMAAVLGIVRGHKGAIKVYSEPDRGTTFKILLPASSRLPEAFNNPGPLDTWQGKGTVLLVDDEETVRGIGRELLQELGFTVITADDGKEAIDIFKGNPDILLVILDLTMPRMDGEQCFRELRQLAPDVKVIMSSGYSEQEVTQKFAGKGLAGFIQKPYKLSMLQEITKTVITRTTSEHHDQ